MTVSYCPFSCQASKSPSLSLYPSHNLDSYSTDKTDAARRDPTQTLPRTYAQPSICSGFCSPCVSVPELLMLFKPGASSGAPKYGYSKISHSPFSPLFSPFLPDHSHQQTRFSSHLKTNSSLDPVFFSQSHLLASFNSNSPWELYFLPLANFSTLFLQTDPFRLLPPLTAQNLCLSSSPMTMPLL